MDNGRTYFVSSALTTDFSDLTVVNTFDNYSDAFVFANSLARDARADGYPLALVTVGDGSHVLFTDYL